MADKLYKYNLHLGLFFPLISTLILQADLSIQTAALYQNQSAEMWIELHATVIYFINIWFRFQVLQSFLKLLWLEFPVSNYIVVKSLEYKSFGAICSYSHWFYLVMWNKIGT